MPGFYSGFSMTVVGIDAAMNIFFEFFQNNEYGGMF